MNFCIKKIYLTYIFQIQLYNFSRANQMYPAQNFKKSRAKNSLNTARNMVNTWVYIWIYIHELLMYFQTLHYK